jgi:predicted transcriptional regulator
VDEQTSTSSDILSISPDRDADIVKALASMPRMQILRLLRHKGPMNVNEISDALDLPQSTVATNVQTLEACGLIETRAMKANKGRQKVCYARYGEIMVRFDDPPLQQKNNLIEVAMPIGLYTSCSVSAPCGLCSAEGVIGLLDVPDFFLDPSRMKASLLWFWRGHVEYKFPNNARVLNAEVEAIEFTLELSSEVPGTNADWPSDISIWVNDVKVATWTSPGDYGDKRGRFTPRWWKLEGSQYGHLTTWVISKTGTSVNGSKASDVTLGQLGLLDHHSIRLRVGIDEGAQRPGGVNIFGKRFGNHDQDIVMRIHVK